MAGHQYDVSINFTGQLKDDLGGIYRSSYMAGNVTRYLFNEFDTITLNQRLHLNGFTDIKVIRFIGLEYSSSYLINAMEIIWYDF